MKRRKIIAGLVLALAAAVGAAVTAPAEVVDNLDFFSDFELLSNLEILEENPASDDVAVSTSPAAGETAASTDTVKASTAAVEGL